MIFFIDLITFLLSTIFLVSSIKKLINGKFSLFYVCLIVYYFMNCFPIGLQFYYELDFAKDISSIFYKALTDEYVSLCYDILTLLTCCIFYLWGNKYSKTNGNGILVFSSFKMCSVIDILITLMMFFPIVLAVSLAPQPNIYWEYAYFYTVDDDMLSIEGLYHNYIINPVLYVSFLFTLLKYFNKRHSSIFYSIDIYFCIFLITWISQKRTIMVFLLLGILMIDFFKRNDYKKLIKKSALFITVIVVYFIYYSKNVKDTGSDLFQTFTMYFSRLNVEKVAIYDLFNDDKMLDYRGQSVLYDFVFFVPRVIWPSKPAMYTKYFTAYVDSGCGSESYWLPFNYQVNIWGDWVSSFGIIGHFFALCFIYFVIRKSEQSTSKTMYISGAVFIILYLMYGFEHLVACLWLVWFYCLVVKYKKKSKPSYNNM